MYLRASVLASSYDTHWLLSHVMISTAATGSNVTVAPAATTSRISTAERIPEVLVQGPGLPPPEKGQPAAKHEELVIVKPDSIIS